MTDHTGVKGPWVQRNGVKTFLRKVAVVVEARSKDTEAVASPPYYDPSPGTANDTNTRGNDNTVPSAIRVQETQSVEEGEISLASRASRSTPREEGEAGPSTPYRRSLRLGDSTTSFLDVSDSISDISEYPVSGGGYCDVHTAFMTGEGVVALKRLRLFGNVEKALKVSAHPLKKSLLEVTHPPP